MVYKKDILPTREYLLLQEALIKTILKENKPYKAQVFTFYWDDLIKKLKKKMPKNAQIVLARSTHLNFLLKAEVSQILTHLTELKAIEALPYVAGRYRGDKMYGVRQGQLLEVLYLTKKDLEELKDAGWGYSSVYEKSKQTFYRIGSTFEIGFITNSRKDIIFNLLFNARGGYVSIEKLCQSHLSLIDEDGQLKRGKLQTDIGHMNGRIEKITEEFKIANNGEDSKKVSAYRIAYFPTM